MSELPGCSAVPHELPEPGESKIRRANCTKFQQSFKRRIVQLYIQHFLVSCNRAVLASFRWGRSTGRAENLSLRVLPFKVLWRFQYIVHTVILCYDCYRAHLLFCSTCYSAWIFISIKRLADDVRESGGADYLFESSKNKTPASSPLRGQYTLKWESVLRRDRSSQIIHSLERLPKNDRLLKMASKVVRVFSTANWRTPIG